jgi:hypothetical protein
LDVEYISHDIVRIWKTADGGRSLGDLVAILYRGDGLNVLERCEAATRVRLSDGREGWVRGVLRTTVKPVLAFAFIDVGQGDACLITTPCGHRLLVDGGENKLAARYLAARFREETAAGRDVHFDALVVTHGDADHFDGLSTLVLDAADETREGKHIRISARRVFHNGLVKRASSAPERELLGSPLNHQEVPHVVVVDDPRVVLDANRPFQRWQRALSELDARGLMTVAHLDSSSSDAFAFLHDVHVAVLGPRTVRLANGQLALPLLARRIASRSLRRAPSMATQSFSGSPMET